MSSRSPTATPRRHRRGLTRNAAACQRCRRRKQKCDGKTPACGSCLGAGATCIMSERLVLRQERGCECDTLRSQLNALQKSYDDLQAQIISLYDNPQVANSITPSAVESQTAIDNHPAIDDDHHSSYALLPEAPWRDTGHRTDRVLKSTFSRRGRGNLTSAWELWGDDKGQDMPIGNDPEVSDDTYKNLVDGFFDKRWPYYPVFHKPTLISQHLIPFLSQSGGSPLSKFLVNIVCALAETEKQDSRTNYDCHLVFFNEATKHISTIMHGDDFESLQCLLLLSMYGLNEPESVDIGYTSGLALNLAVGMDLHRKESLNGQTQLQAEMLKRVFWSTYVMSCTVVMNLGRPLGIQISDISMPLPSNFTDEDLVDSLQPLHIIESAIPKTTDTSTFIHIIKLRRINAGVYRNLHSVGSTFSNLSELDSLRANYLSELQQWLVAAPRYICTLSTFQSTEWFEIAFHHGVLSLYRPCRAAPMPSFDDLRTCNESAIGLISAYSSLYARNRIKYTFVAIHSLFMAAVTMLYSLRASASLRQELTKPVVQTNIQTFLTLFRGISNGRPVGEKCSDIIERLGTSILSLFDSVDPPDSQVDLEFQSWFGVQSHTFATPGTTSALGDTDQPQDFSTLSIDMPWADLFTEGVDMSFTDVSSLFC